MKITNCQFEVIISPLRFFRGVATRVRRKPITIISTVKNGHGKIISLMISASVHVFPYSQI